MAVVGLVNCDVDGERVVCGVGWNGMEMGIGRVNDVMLGVQQWKWG